MTRRRLHVLIAFAALTLNGWAQDPRPSRGTRPGGTGSPVVPSTQLTTNGIIFPDNTAQTTAAATNVTAGSGLSLLNNGSTLSLITNCLAGDILKWNGSAWACAGDATSPGGSGSTFSGSNSTQILLSTQTNSVQNTFPSLSNPTPAAIRGHASATTGSAVGVIGSTNASQGFGVYGMSLSTSTEHSFGVVGEAAGGRGAGVLGQVNGNTGDTWGVWGTVFSPQGTGGVFQNFSASGGDLIRGINNQYNKVFRVDSAGAVFANGGYNTGGADFAEAFDVRGEVSTYEPGDVLVIDVAGERRLAKTNQPYSRLVAGIYSTKPGVLASPRSVADGLANDIVPLAVVGVVPCKVTNENGPIEIGDLLVTSSTPGHAMKGTRRERMLGAVIGKALQAMAGSTGVIEVLVSLQ